MTRPPRSGPRSAGDAATVGCGKHPEACFSGENHGAASHFAIARAGVCGHPAKQPDGGADSAVTVTRTERFDIGFTGDALACLGPGRAQRTRRGIRIGSIALTTGLAKRRQSSVSCTAGTRSPRISDEIAARV